MQAKYSRVYSYHKAFTKELEIINRLKYHIASYISFDNIKDAENHMRCVRFMIDTIATNNNKLYEDYKKYISFTNLDIQDKLFDYIQNMHFEILTMSDNHEKTIYFIKHILSNFIFETMDNSDKIRILF